MTLDELNRLRRDEAAAALERCCGAPAWVSRLCAERPFASAAGLDAAAERVWWELGPVDWREAFTHHPRIGDVEGLRQRFAATASWATSEQSGAAAAGEAVIAALAEGNRAYEERFGHIFIVCATGKTADEMLALLRARIGNDPDAELRIAAGEQMKITKLRLEKLLAGARVSADRPGSASHEKGTDRMSGITTHVLDLSLGCPASGVSVRLERRAGVGWTTLAERVTDADGRVKDLIPAGVTLEPGIHRLTFATGVYQAARGTPTFYPEVPVVFEIKDSGQHHHVPLLLGPFGYSTYRGS